MVASGAADIASLTPIISDVVAPLVIGNFLSAIGVGIVLSLSVQYASSYGGRDKAIFQALVALMTVLSVADAGNLASWCYRWTVSAVMQPELLEELPVEATLGCFFTGITVALAQTFYAVRIWIISGRTNHLLFGALLFMTAAGFAAQLRMAVSDIEHSHIADLLDIETTLLIWCGIVACTDLAITVSMWWYVIYRNRQHRSTATAVHNSPFTKVIARCVQTNTIALVVQALILILVGAMRLKMWYGLFAWMETKIYAGSLIATLNVRRSPSAPSAGFDSSSLSTSKQRKTSPNPASHILSNLNIGPTQTFVYVQRDVEITVESPSPGQTAFPQNVFAGRPSMVVGRDDRFAIVGGKGNCGAPKGEEQEGEKGGRKESWDAEMARIG